MKIFGREPVYWLTFVAVTLKLLAAYGIDVSDTQQAAVNAVVAAAVGIASAVVLKTGAVAAAILGFAQSALALFGAFGLDWTAHTQGLVMSGVAAALALILHREVTAPVPETALEATSIVKTAAPAVGPVADPQQTDAPGA